MAKEKDQFKAQLDDELQSIQFMKQKEVLKRTHPTSWKYKLTSLWNKEIEIPLLPVSAIFALIILTIGYKELNMNEQIIKEDKVIVEVAGNYYWKDELERVMVEHEN